MCLFDASPFIRRDCSTLHSLHLQTHCKNLPCTPLHSYSIVRQFPCNQCLLYTARDFHLHTADFQSGINSKLTAVPRLLCPLYQAAYQFPLRLFPAFWLTVTATQNELYAQRFMPAFHKGWLLVLSLSRTGNWTNRKPSSSPYFGSEKCSLYYIADHVYGFSSLFMRPCLRLHFHSGMRALYYFSIVPNVLIIIQYNVRWRIRNLPRHQWQLFDQPIDLLIVRDFLSQWIES